MSKLNEETKKVAVNLAMTIECGVYTPQQIISIVNDYPDVMVDFIDFWQEFNDMTRNAAQIVINEKCRNHITNCYTKRATSHPFDV